MDLPRLGAVPWLSALKGLLTSRCPGLRFLLAPLSFLRSVPAQKESVVLYGPHNKAHSCQPAIHGPPRREFIICFLLMRDRLPPSGRLKTTPIYYPTVSMGRESRHSVPGPCSGSLCWDRHVSQTSFLYEVWGPLPSSRGRKQNSFPCSYRILVAASSRIAGESPSCFQSLSKAWTLL